MKKTEKLILIEGKFTNEDALEILRNIFSTKIDFHQLKNFSSQVRFGKDDEIAQNRIPELKKELEKLELILSDSETKNRKLTISSEINISLTND